MADPSAMFFFRSSSVPQGEKKYDLYVLSASKLIAVGSEKIYGYFSLFSGYFSYLDLFSADNFRDHWLFGVTPVAAF